MTQPCVTSHPLNIVPQTYFYRLGGRYREDGECLLMHQTLFDKTTWERMILEAVNALPEFPDDGPNDTPYDVTRYLIRHHGFAEPMLTIDDDLWRYFDDDSEPLSKPETPSISFGYFICPACGARNRTIYTEGPVTHACTCGHVTEEAVTYKEGGE